MQLWKAAAAPSSVYGVPGLESSDRSLVAEDWEGSQVGALKGAGFEVAMERGGHRGNGGVSGGHAGKVQGIVWKARVDEDRDGEEVPGRARPALGCISLCPFPLFF